MFFITESCGIDCVSDHVSDAAKLIGKLGDGSFVL